MRKESSDRASPTRRKIPALLGLGLAASMLLVAGLLPPLLNSGDARAEGTKNRAKSSPSRVQARRRKPIPKPSPAPAPAPSPTPRPAVVSTPWVVFGYSDLGMHCMNQDDSELCLLPPYSTYRAQVIIRGEEPHIVTSGATVSYSIPGNTYSVGKSNFWNYVQALFGVKLPPNIGLTGNGLTGRMSPTSNNDWQVTAVPLTPIMDNGKTNTFALGKITVTQGSKTMATTQAVLPVSWEISCNLCHNRPGFPTTAADILEAHDRLHNTNLQNQKPVLCAICHADPALGTTGVAGVPTLSASMHTAHASRFTPPVLAQVNGINCYACHPGINTQCQRDIHLTKGIHCGDCHGTMTAVGNPNRIPWTDEPKCANCHNVPGHQYEEPGKLYKQSRGHNGVMCTSCHGAPHAITPTVTANDNVQAITLQGYAGTIDNCVVCHKRRPDDSFNHSLGEGGGGD